jgi:hypothetical protein
MWMRSRMLAPLAALSALAFLVAGTATHGAGDASVSAKDRQPRFPIRAAFYYAWFPETWGLQKEGRQEGRNGSPFTHFRPSLGWYRSTDSAVIRRHLRAFHHGRIEAGIVSWWGRSHESDRRLARILDTTTAARSRVRWAIYYECEGDGATKVCGPDRTVPELASDLAYLERTHFHDPAYLRVGGRPVIFVWGDGGDACPMSARWREANAVVGAFLVLKLFHGYRGCRPQPDSWHEYAPSKAIDLRPGESVAVSPGFWHADERAPRLPRDVARFRRGVRTMVASRAPWQLVTTFNEWGEGTSVESARQWSSRSGYGAYLDALHDNGR